MARMIDADPLLKKAADLEAVALEQVRKYEPLDKPSEWRTWSAILTERSAFKYDLMDAPTIEAEPIRHGHWKPYKTEQGRTVGIYCSECGQFLLMNATPSCPYCRAKMDEEEQA